MPVGRVANAEPLPGYRLLEPLGRGGFGEVWKCQAPGGFLKALKFVGATSDDETALEQSGHRAIRQEQHALELLRTLRHPFLLSVERVEVIDDELLILTELADRSLYDLLRQYQEQGQAGIPRLELLEYLREAAEVLDLLNYEHGLQHLDVKPHNLFLIGGHVKVGDFGLVGSLEESAGPPDAKRPPLRVSPAYAAPERFAGKVSPSCDQYSLAIAYAELATGRLPFGGTDFRSLSYQHQYDEPDLTALPEADRSTVRKALAKDPDLRFPSCLAFLHALLYPGAAGTRSLRRLCNPVGEGAQIQPAVKPGSGERATVQDTVASASATTQTETGVESAAGSDPLVGCTFLDCLVRLPFGEFWRVRNPQGEEKLVKLVFGFESRSDASGRNPLERLGQLRHPGLIEIEATTTPGRLVLVSPYPTRTLVDRLAEVRAGGAVGISREELLAYLGKIADLLDTIRAREGLRHLGLNPRQLVLDEDDEVHLADLGLVELVWRPAGRDAAALNPRYSAPELFGGQTGFGRGNQSDQFSLALIFAELLTGEHPYRHLSLRQMAAVKTRGEPDLSLTPARDRPILATALDPDPLCRFQTCREMINALVDASSNQPPRSFDLRRPAVALPPLLRRTALGRVLRQLTDQAASGQQVREFGQQRFLLLPGEKIVHTCYARLVPSTLAIKLSGFCERWQATAIRADGRQFLYHIRVPPTLLERFLGRHPGLEVSFTLMDQETTTSLATLRVEMRPISCGQTCGTDLLEGLGPLVLNSLRDHLQAAPERRKQERFPFERPVTVYPLREDDELGPGIEGRTRNVSLGGLGVLLPSGPEGQQEQAVALHLRALDPQGVLLAGRIVRSGLCKDGRHDLGIVFDDIPTS